MARPMLEWEETRRTRFIGPAGIRHVKKEQFAHGTTGHSQPLRAHVASDGFGHVRVKYYCSAHTECIEENDRLPILPLTFRTFGAARVWAQWRYEECCARQVENVLMSMPSDDDDDGAVMP